MLREALSGAHRDYTVGSIGRAIALLSIPMVLEMSMESLFGVVDAFFVSRLGAGALTIVGLTESLLTIVFGVAIGLSLATTAYVARRTGEKDPEGAASGATQAILIGIAISIVFGVAGVVLAPRLLAIMGAEPAIVRDGARYTALMLGGSIVIFLLFLINAIFRGAGDAALAMRSLWLANAVNIVLDPCLINGWGPFPRFGVFGAAIATTTGRGIGVLFQFYILFAGKGRVAIRPSQMRIVWPVLIRILRVSVAGILQFLIATASWLGLIRIVSSFGSDAVAGYTIAVRMLVFAILPSWGMANAAATLVGQNLGAGKPGRAESSVYRTALYNMMYMGLVSLAFIFIPQHLAAIFTKDAEVARVTAQCLRIFSFGFLSYAWGMVLVQAFNGAGDTWTPTILNFLCLWALQIPFAYWLAYGFGWGPEGAFSAVPVADLVLTSTAFWLFRRGRWKLQAI